MQVPGGPEQVVANREVLHERLDLDVRDQRDELVDGRQDTGSVRTQSVAQVIPPQSPVHKKLLTSQASARYSWTAHSIPSSWPGSANCFSCLPIEVKHRLGGGSVAEVTPTPAPARLSASTHRSTSCPHSSPRSPTLSECIATSWARYRSPWVRSCPYAPPTVALTAPLPTCFLSSHSRN